MAAARLSAALQGRGELDQGGPLVDRYWTSLHGTRCQAATGICRELDQLDRFPGRKTAEGLVG